MRVRVLFFGALKDLTGRSSDQLTLPAGATLADVLSHYKSQFPGLNQYVPSLALSLNQEYASPGASLNEGDEIGLLPPVSGGASSTQASSVECALVRQRIDTAALSQGMKRGEDGAVVVFEGTVRNNTRGRRTLYLNYEAYETMALAQMRALVAEARQKFAIRDGAIVHRLGRLEIGETSVAIVVASAHRVAAFEACRWLIDTLKRTVPVWKKEFFEDGAVWADGEPFPDEVRVAQSNAAPPSSEDSSPQ